MFERGQRVGSFVIEERIARGGIAEIYRAYQPVMDRAVALKIISLSDRSENARDAALRFEHEAQIIARLEHPHILTIHEYGTIDGEYAYIAMRLMTGGSLDEMLARAPLTVEQSLNIFAQIALALDFAHSRGIIHRDIKPSNILLDDAGNAYLADFGLAKLVEMSFGWTETGTLVGTPIYASPEQLLDSDTLDYRTDLYSLAVVLYHALVGSPPFEMNAQGIVDLIQRHISDPPPPPRGLNPDLTPEVESVLLKALEKKPANRYPSASTMIRALASAANLPLPNHFPLQNEPVARVRRGWWNGLVLAAGAVVLLLVLAAALALLSENGGSGITRTYTLLVDRDGEAADTVPLPDQNEAARERLRTDGFIAYSACTLDTDLSATVARLMADVAAEYGVPFRVYDEQMDAGQQVEDIDQMVGEGAEAVIVCPLNATSVIPATRDLHEAGIPVVAFSSPLADTAFAVEIANEELGRLVGGYAGQIINEELGGSADVIILALPEVVTSDEIVAGMRGGLEAAAPEAVITGIYRGLTRENSQEVVFGLLAEGERFDIILCVNDAAAFGAIAALEAAGFAPDSIPIVSINAEALARQYIRNGRFIRASAAINREMLARAAVNAAVKMLGGGTLPRSAVVPPGELITSETIAETSLP